MQQGSDYGYYSQHYPPYNPNPNPNPNPNLNPNPGEYPPSNPTYASAPPYSQYGGPDLPSYPSSYPPYSQTLDPVSSLPPSAPSYSQPPPPPQPKPQPQPEAPPQHPPFQQYNASSYSAEPAASPYAHPQQSYYPHDPHQSAGGYGSGPNSNPSPNPNPSFNTNPIPNPSLSFSSPYPSYEKPYESDAQRFDHGGGYLGDNPSQYGAGMTGSYGRSSSGVGQDFYERRPDSGYQHDHASIQDDVLGAGVYRYDGGGAEPYGARGTGGTARSSLSSWSAFDDYGRSTSFSSAGKDQGSGGMGKIVRAVPKAETQQDVKSGVQKFRVKLLAEGSGQSTTDVLCQIGLDGIRMLDPSTSRTLRIYPLETVTRWEVSDPSIYSFWSKSSVDIDPRRIRLQSNRYTTSTILDTVAAATVQLKEMGGKESLSRSKVPSDAGKQSEQSNEKRKGFEWMNFIKPGTEEKEHWVPDEAVTKCTSCGVDFSAFVRKHHCRNCGDIFCDKCTHGRIALTAEENAQPVRVCDRCMAEVTQRLNNAKEAASRSAAVHSHEDLARRLQEEMDRNRKTSAGSKSTDTSGRRMREVACPTCTVHLQVQVPTSGSETIECGVCQQPFLVSAH